MLFLLLPILVAFAGFVVTIISKEDAAKNKYEVSRSGPADETIWIDKNDIDGKQLWSTLLWKRTKGKYGFKARLSEAGKVLKVEYYNKKFAEDSGTIDFVEGEVWVEVRFSSESPHP